MSRPSQLQILGENFVNSDCIYAVTSGDTTKVYLYDQKPSTQWLSVSSTDAVTETITVTFYNKYGNACNRTIDTVILNNTNGKQISVSTYLSGTPTVLGTATGAAENIVITGTAAVCDSFVVSITTTQTANQEKRVGELRACLSVMTVNATTKFKRQDNRRGDTFRVRSGALVRWLEYQRIEGELTIQNLTLSQRNTLNDALDANPYLTFIFYGTYNLEEIYEFAIMPAPTENFDRITEYFEITLPLKGR